MNNKPSKQIEIYRHVALRNMHLESYGKGAF